MDSHRHRPSQKRVYAVLVRNTCVMRRRTQDTDEEEDTRVYAVLVRNTCVMCRAEITYEEEDSCHI